jgi:hypothetical protein
VGVGMTQGLVPVPMRVWLGNRTIMMMLMMIVMNMTVFVFEHVMVVFMGMSLGQMQP